ncbi:MAG: cytochrome b5-like heme/steroid binding domain-containing protein [archaeon]|jgi:cytochrome b involved in lipid metabolism
MKKIIIFLQFFFIFVLLFGCTISVNPLDLAPNKNYLPYLDTNGGATILDNNSATGITQTKISLTASEVAKHSSVGNCWMIINGKVYDLSDYVVHPGGNGYLTYCGTDATNGYDTKGGRGNMHSNYADALLATYLVGTLGQEIIVNSSALDTNSLQNSSGTITQPQPQRPFRPYDDEWDD